MSVVHVLVLVGVGLFAGTLGSLVGVGGGVIVGPALIAIVGLTPKMATGTSIAVIVPTMLVALWRRGIQGHVDYRLAAVCAVGAIAGAFLGSDLAGRLPEIWIRRTLAGFLAAVSVWLFVTE